MAEEFCTGCNYDHTPEECSYGMNIEEYERASGDYRGPDRDVPHSIEVVRRAFAPMVKGH